MVSTFFTSCSVLSEHNALLHGPISVISRQAREGESLSSDSSRIVIEALAHHTFHQIDWVGPPSPSHAPESYREYLLSAFRAKLRYM